MWKSFLGEAPDRPFEANRFVNWRFFWDYSGGNFYENMCHQTGVLVQGARPADRDQGELQRRRLPVEGRARGARHHDRRDGALRRTDVHLGFRVSATTS